MNPLLWIVQLLSWYNAIAIFSSGNTMFLWTVSTRKHWASKQKNEDPWELRLLTASLCTNTKPGRQWRNTSSGQWNRLDHQETVQDWSRTRQAMVHCQDTDTTIWVHKIQGIWSLLYEAVSRKYSAQQVVLYQYLFTSSPLWLQRMQLFRVADSWIPFSPYTLLS